MGLYEWLYWGNADEVWVVQKEADDLMKMVYAGIDALIANPELLHSLRSNYETVYRSIMTEKLEYYDSNIKIKRLSEWKLDVNTTFELEWANPYTASGEGFTDTQRDLRNLQLWRDDANPEFVLRRQSRESI